MTRTQLITLVIATVTMAILMLCIEHSDFTTHHKLMATLFIGVVYGRIYADCRPSKS
jgi:hypothetical protein